jgi:hypothetical protein
VQRLPRVFLHVHAGDAHALRRAAGDEFQCALRRERELVLRYLIPLRQIRIKVVLSRKNRLFVHRTIQRQRGFRGEIDGPAIQNRERARKPQTDRADVGVRFMTESRAAAAENLGIREQPGVYFEPYNGFKSHEG